MGHTFGPSAGQPAVLSSEAHTGIAAFTAPSSGPDEQLPLDGHAASIPKALTPTPTLPA